MLDNCCLMCMKGMKVLISYGTSVASMPLVVMSYGMKHKEIP